MKRYGSMLLLCMSMNILPFFDYDRAISWAQRNLWPDAGKALNRLVAEQPDNGILLYDAGVAAFNNEDYQQAKAYFASAAESSSVPRELKAQAYFNKGNAHVALKELKEALLSYEQVLQLNPADEQAKHNYETVKKMLESQEQEQQKKDQQNQNQQNDQQCSQDQKQNENQQQQQKNKQQQDKNQPQSNNQNKPQDGQPDDSDNSDDSPADQEQENGEHQQGDENSLDQEGDQQDQQEDGLNEQKDETQEDEQRDKGRDSDQKTQSNEQKQQQERKAEHQSPSDKNKAEQQQQNKQAEEKEQDIDQDDEQSEAVTLDPRLERVLEKRSDRDALLNKQIVKALVNQGMKGHHGQNCW